MRKKEIVNISDYYLNKAELDEKAGDILAEQGLYTQAIYFKNQYMEKLIKSEISKKIDIKNKYAENLIKNHSIKELIFLLIDIIIPDAEKTLKNQLKTQIESILGKINYDRLHNNLRYPYYNFKSKEFLFIEYNKNDYEQIVNNSFKQLKNYMYNLYKL